MGIKSIKPYVRIKIRIKNDSWTVNLYSHYAFSKIWPDDLGITEYHHVKNLRRINLRGPKVSRDTIAHELMHAYLSYYDFSKLSYGKIEEQVCEVLGKNHKRLYLLTEKIYNVFNKKIVA